MSDPRSSEISEEATEISRATKLLIKEARSFQQAPNIENDLPKALRSSEKVQMWLKTGVGGTTTPSTDEPRRFQHGWLAPYIEHDLSARTLRSSEKVELWIRAHFSHPISESAYNKEGNSLQYGEKTNATESVLTSLAALEISRLEMISTLNDEERINT